MRFTNRILFNPDTAIASPPASGGSLADSVMSAIASKATIPANPFQAGVQTVYSRSNGQTTVTPIETTPTPTMDSLTVAPGPAAANPAQELQPPVVNEPPAQPANKDYIIVRHPETGQILTRIKNDPDTVASYVQNQQLFIKQLRDSSAPRQAPMPQPAAPTADQIRAADVQRAREIAGKHFPKTYADGTPVDLNPMADTLADLVGQVRAEFRGEFEQRERTAQQAQVVARQDQELAEVMRLDNSFALDSPDVIRLREQYPDAGPKQIQALRVYEQFLQFRANPPVNPAPQQPAQSAPAPAQKVPDTTWMQPNGSAAPAQSGYDTHPYVIDAINSFVRMAPSLRQEVTQESIERIKQIAISTIKNTEAAKGGFR